MSNGFARSVMRLIGLLLMALAFTAATGCDGSPVEEGAGDESSELTKPTRVPNYCGLNGGSCRSKIFLAAGEPFCGATGVYAGAYVCGEQRFYKSCCYPAGTKCEAVGGKCLPKLQNGSTSQIQANLACSANTWCWLTIHNDPRR